uniref:Secreted mucin n=1 Tax=Anopheles melas TaxID=34690 RepID=A0A182TPW9_9DIPT
MHSPGAPAYVFLQCLVALVAAVIAQSGADQPPTTVVEVTAHDSVSMTPPTPRSPLLNETELVELNQPGSTAVFVALPTNPPTVSVDSSSTSTVASTQEPTSTTERTMSPEEIQKLLLPPATVEADILHVNATDDNRPDAKSSGK